MRRELPGEGEGPTPGVALAGLAVLADEPLNVAQRPPLVLRAQAFTGECSKDQRSWSQH